MHKGIVLGIIILGIAIGSAFVLVPIHNSESSPESKASQNATAADGLPLHLVSQTSTTITLGWTPVPGYGYLFSSGGVLRSRTNNADTSTVKFTKVTPASYDVDQIVKGMNGHYPASVAGPTATFTMVPAPATVGQSVTFTWTGTCDAGGCTAVWEDEGTDGPGGTDYPLGTGATFVKAFAGAGVKYVHLVVTDAVGGTDETRQQLTIASSPPPTAACADGIDNDSDGKIDYPADPGCLDSTDNSEVDAVPAAACADTLDNDADGKIDYPADPGCTSATDTDETDVAPPTGNVFITATGNDANACTAASPCRTFARGYAAAASGNTISVAGGTYPGVQITGNKTVTFQATGAVTVAGQMDFNGGANVTVVGPLTIASGSNDFDVRAQCANNITLRNVSGRLIWIYNGSSNISFYGGNWGGYTGIEDSAVSGYNGSGTSTCSTQGDGIVRNVLFDGIRFHDANYGPSSTWGGAHPDCLQLMGGIDGLTIRNSVIERCGNTFFGWYPDFGDNKNLLVENNLMRAVYESSWSMQIGYKPTGDCSVVFRYNIVDTSVGNSDVPPLIRCGLGEQVYGNIITNGIGSDPTYCVPGFSYNVYEQGACGANAVTGNPGWVARSTSATSAYDYHLAAGALAIGKGDPTRFPGTDFEGTLRSAPPDAGWDER